MLQPFALRLRPGPGLSAAMLALGLAALASGCQAVAQVHAQWGDAAALLVAAPLVALAVLGAAGTWRRRAGPKGVTLQVDRLGRASLSGLRGRDEPLPVRLESLRIGAGHALIGLVPWPDAPGVAGDGQGLQGREYATRGASRSSGSRCRGGIGSNRSGSNAGGNGVARMAARMHFLSGISANDRRTWHCFRVWSLWSARRGDRHDSADEHRRLKPRASAPSS